MSRIHLCIGAALLAASIGGAWAQDKPANPKIGYSSVFDNYVPFTFLPDISWREANDRVGEIGGWRAYLELVQDANRQEAEAQEGDDQ